MISLHNKDGEQLLDTIDELRRYGLNELIDLPQIIVVGQQSAGKSSVLEAISGIPFPTNDGLCTRFATEIVLRKNAVTKARASIQPSMNCEPQRRKRLESFQHDNIELSDMAAIYAKVVNVLEMPNDSSICADVVKLEIWGPHQETLTLVDLPGLFETPKSDQPGSDKDLVRKLVEEYMAQTRSIILAVVTAKNDWQNQIITSMVNCDNLRERTLGIITGLDTIAPGSPDNTTFRSLAENKQIKLGHGWHLLRNPNFTEARDPNFHRHAVEANFFESVHPWTEMSASQVGVVKLKDRLGHLLKNHISRELPSLMTAIDANIQNRQSVLDRLKEPRSSARERRKYLENIERRFRDLVKDALDGQYVDKFFQGSTERLRANLSVANSEFATRMRTEGHLWEVVRDDSREVSDESESAFLKDVDNKDENADSSGPLPPHKISQSSFHSFVDTKSRETRGRELPGSHNPLLIGTLFRAQSRKWEGLAKEHTELVLQDVKQLLESALECASDPERADLLWQRKLDADFANKSELLHAKTKELLVPYKGSHPITLSPRYTEALSKLEATDPKQALMESSKCRPTDSMGCKELAHSAQCYYDVALETFVDNIATLAIECCLLHGLKDLLIISDMADDEVEELASEWPEDIATRQQAQADMDLLKKCRGACQKHARRKVARTERQLPSRREKTVEDKPLPSSTDTAASPTGSGRARVASSPRTPMTHSPASSNGSDVFDARTPTPITEAGNVVVRPASPVPETMFGSESKKYGSFFQPATLDIGNAPQEPARSISPFGQKSPSRFGGYRSIMSGN